MRYAGARYEAPRVVAAGETVSLVVDAFPREPELVRPDQSSRPLTGETVETAEGRWRLPEIAGNETARVGLYSVRQDNGSSEPFAVQLAPREGNLERLLASELSGLHPALSVVTAETDSGETEAGPNRGEIWRWLAAIAFAALVLESLWGAWIGQRRKVIA